MKQLLAKSRWLAMAALLALALPAAAQQKKPNILVIFGDDIGYWNVSVNNRGMMGYRTPNIDRIAKEGFNLDHVLQKLQEGTVGKQ